MSFFYQNNIQFKQDSYKIIYKQQLSLFGLLFKSKVNIYKISSIRYFIEILDKSNITFLHNIDTYFNCILNKYNKILNVYNKKNGLFFYKNNIISKILNNNHDELYFNIKYINKGYYNNPIIHIYAINE